jgi:hypothetical protein
VVERAGARFGIRVEQATHAARGHRHADGVAEALAERAGGGLHAERVAVLRVAGGQAAPLPERLEVVQAEAIAGEVELDVEGQARVPTGKDEPVATEPAGISGVVP